MILVVETFWLGYTVKVVFVLSIIYQSGKASIVINSLILFLFKNKLFLKKLQIEKILGFLEKHIERKEPKLKEQFTM